jgi:hypothetical protein
MVLVTADVPADSTLEREVDIDIETFEQWFCTRIDSSTPKLANVERAIIKTFLAYKLGLANKTPTISTQSVQ